MDVEQMMKAGKRKKKKPSWLNEVREDD